MYVLLKRFRIFVSPVAYLGRLCVALLLRRSEKLVTDKVTNSCSQATFNGLTYAN